MFGAIGCPFCGNEAQEQHGLGSIVYIACADCGASTRNADNANDAWNLWRSGMLYARTTL